MRDPLDRYYTPGWAAEGVVQCLIENGHLVPGDRVWEPHAGAGAILDALREHEVNAIGTDIAPAREDIYRLAAERVMTSAWTDVNAVVCNPPFALAEGHLRAFLGRDGIRTVAAILRLGFLASTKRRPFFEAYPVDGLYVFSTRPSFTQGGTDSRDYALFVWDAAATRVRIGAIHRST